jgi:hypothetical protein
MQFGEPGWIGRVGGVLPRWKSASIGQVSASLPGLEVPLSAVTQSQREKRRGRCGNPVVSLTDGKVVPDRHDRKKRGHAPPC